MVIIIFNKKELKFNSLEEAKEYFKDIEGHFIYPAEQESKDDPYAHYGMFIKK
jgi:hypothetical protein